MNLHLLLAIANLPSDNHPEGGDMADFQIDEDRDGKFIAVLAVLVVVFVIGVVVGLSINS